MAFIHPTAIVSEDLCLGEDVTIGPYCRVGPQVILGDRVHLHSHVVIEGFTHLDKETEVFPFSVLGGSPQKVNHNPHDKTYVHIGAYSQIREHVTIHRGTLTGEGVTRLGERCLVMVGCHVGHDSHLGENIVMANQSILGGHVRLGNHVVLGGMTVVHQFTRIGEGAMVEGFSAIARDVIPYGMAGGRRGVLEGLNLKKLRMLGVETKEISILLKAYKWVFEDRGGKTLSHRIQSLPAAWQEYATVRKIQDFLAQTARPLCLPGIPSDNTLSL